MLRNELLDFGKSLVEAIGKVSPEPQAVSVKAAITIATAIFISLVIMFVCFYFYYPRSARKASNSSSESK